MTVVPGGLPAGNWRISGGTASCFATSDFEALSAVTGGETEVVTGGPAGNTGEVVGVVLELAAVTGDVSGGVTGGDCSISASAGFPPVVRRQ